MMVNEERGRAWRKAGRVAWKVLLPFSAMRKSVTLARREIDRTKDNLVVLKDLGADARKAVAENLKGNAENRDDSFDAAMRNRSDDALPASELYRAFLRKKRFALGTAAFFALLSMYGILGGIWYGHTRGIVLGLISLIASQPVFFLVALGAQLRLWQLRTHRLSKAERGGLQDFMREVRGWWWVTLDPEFGRKKRRQP